MTTDLEAAAVLKDSADPGSDVLKTVQAVALNKTLEMRVHLPEHYFSSDLRAGNTFLARSSFGVNGKGRRTPRVLLVDELVPLTALTGESFVKAWLDVVTCHASLWKHGIKHGDPSLPNVMCNPVKQCGILTDFDLSTMARSERIRGNDRTGTIPFMAVDLLSHVHWDGYSER